MQILGHLHEELGLLQLVGWLGWQAFGVALHDGPLVQSNGVLLAVATSIEVAGIQLEIGIDDVAPKFPNCMRNLPCLDVKATFLLSDVVELVRIEPEFVLGGIEHVDAGPDHDNEVQHEQNADDSLDSNSESLAPYGVTRNSCLGGLSVVLDLVIVNNRNKVVRPLLEEIELGISEDLGVQSAVEVIQKHVLVDGDTESNYLVVQDAPMVCGVPFNAI